MVGHARRNHHDGFDDPVTAARERSAGRLLGDAGEVHDEAMVFAELGSDSEDDAHLTAEELAMHLTAAPSFDDDDGYLPRA